MQNRTGSSFLLRGALLCLLASGLLSGLLLPTAASAVLVAPPACRGGTIELRSGSDMDAGWSGTIHDSPLAAGSSLGFRVLSRCTDSQEACESNCDCATQECQATCDCNGDTSCEITGPAQQRHCLTTLTDCSTNADCPPAVPCVAMSAPPLPVSSGGTPFCVVSSLDGPLTGTADFTTGETQLSASLRWRMFLGDTLARPCPQCGTPGDTPNVGDAFTCTGGQFPGAACTVDGVTPTYGGASFDCPPILSGNVSGAGLAIRLPEITTGTTTKTATLPCAHFGFLSNPLNAPANPGTCTDTNDACSSNADCRRCSGDSTIACTADAQCTGNGTCAEAPAQPVTCGFWCHCGFCDGIASLPCFSSSDCGAGQTCQAGPGTGTAQNSPQRMPNDCSGDRFICGQLQSEQCATTEIGHCSDQPYRNCTLDSTTCEDNSAGTCVVTSRPCFESSITRTGSPSPLGSYCAFEAAACVSNGDCTGAGDFCVAEASSPRLQALLCLAGSSSSSVNSVIGIPGPATLHWDALLELCRCDQPQPGCEDVCNPGPVCGNWLIEAGEQCDDGNESAGDGCDASCTTEECYACSPSSPAPVCGGYSVCVATGSGDACDDGNPCSSGETCQASGCTGGSVLDCDDLDPCTDDSCDGQGGCLYSTNTASCDDGEPCTTNDQCSGGQCSGQTVDCDDQNVCTTDTCDGAGGCLHTPAAGSCDDGDLCTVSDQCTGGVCDGQDVLFGQACRWFVVGESETSSDVNLKEASNTVITGDLCLDKAKVGLNSVITGNLIVTQATGAAGIKFAPAVDVTGDIVTGGAGVKGIQNAFLPHLTPAVAALAGGTTAAKDSPPGGTYDTTGASTLLARCNAATAAVDAAQAPLDELVADQDYGDRRLHSDETLNLSPTNVGGLNVIDFDRLTGGLRSPINLSGGGNENTVMIVRVHGKLSLLANCVISLVDGLQPENTIFYGQGKKVQIGDFTAVSGTIFALGKVKLGVNANVEGQIFARQNKVKLGTQLVGTLRASRVVLP